MSRPRVFLSEPALTCCAGGSAAELYAACLRGDRSGVSMREFPGLGSWPAGLVGEGALEAAPRLRGGALPEGRIFRIIGAALAGIEPAVREAVSRHGAERVGLCFGSCDNGSQASLEAHRALLEAGAFPPGYALRLQSAGFPARAISEALGIRGPALAVATACASGASAIARAAELVRSGRCAAAVAGGADAVSLAAVAGFRSLEALSPDPSIPFSKSRRGINLGEGAAFFLLDSREISGVELLGFGESSDAGHMTAPDGDGGGPARAMRAALLDAGLEPGQIGYANLHGTGTALNDRAEARAMLAVFGGEGGAALPPSSSTKPVTGHALGAAGALEAAICWSALAEGRGLPPHCWDGEPDADAPLAPVLPGSREAPGACMSSSFAFGGCNASLILGRAAQWRRQ